LVEDLEAELGVLKASLTASPRVALAVVFGSVARGEARPDSDIDLLVVIRDETPEAVWELRDELETRVERTVQITHLDEVWSATDLMPDVAAHGRLLVDLDDRWPTIVEQGHRLARNRRMRD
jgi:predicted nucleotidyltransferase